MGDSDSISEPTADDLERRRTMFSVVVFQFGDEVASALDELVPEADALRRALWPQGGAPRHLRWDDLMRRWAELERVSLALEAARLGPGSPESARREAEAMREAFEPRYERVVRAAPCPIGELIESEAAGRELRVSDLLTEAHRHISRAMLDVCDAPTPDTRWAATLKLGSYFRRVVMVLAFSERLLGRKERFAQVDSLFMQGAKLTGICETGRAPVVKVRPEDRETIDGVIELVTRGTRAHAEDPALGVPGSRTN